MRRLILAFALLLAPEFQQPLQLSFEQQHIAISDFYLQRHLSATINCVEEGVNSFAVFRGNVFTGVSGGLLYSAFLDNGGRICVRSEVFEGSLISRPAAATTGT